MIYCFDCDEHVDTDYDLSHEDHDNNINREKDQAYEAMLEEVFSSDDGGESEAMGDLYASQYE
jgi:hypothetical protein